MKTPNNKAQASNFLTDREKMGGTSHQTSEKEMGSETTEQKQLKTYLANKMYIENITNTHKNAEHFNTKRSALLCDSHFYYLN